MINAFLDRVNSLDADRAELHYCGEGMAGGIDWHNTCAWHRSSHITFAQKGALETIFCGAFWQNCRVSASAQFSPC